MGMCKGISLVEHKQRYATWYGGGELKLEAAEAVVCGLLRSQDEAEWRPVEVRGLASCTSH